MSHCAPVPPSRARCCSTLPPYGWVFLFLCLIGSLGAGNGAWAQAASDTDTDERPLKEKVEELIHPYQEMDWFSGTLLAAKEGDEFVKSAGMRDRERGMSNTRQTLYPIGAITETFTAAAILHLEEQGRLSTEDPVTEHLSLPHLTGVTLHHLLTHTSGLPDELARLAPGFGEDTTAAFKELTRHPATLDDLVARVEDVALIAEPGERYTTSPANYQLLAAVVEAASGMAYDAYLREHILEPLGLHDTEPADAEALRVRFYQSDGDVEPAFDYSNLRGAGHLLSTVDDLYRWVQALQTDQLLSAASREKLFGNHFRTARQSNVGYGWYETRPGGWTDQTATARGTYYPATAFLTHHPEENITVIVLGNTTATTPNGTLNTALVAAARGQSYHVPTVYQEVPISPALLETYAGIYQVFTATFIALSANDEGLEYRFSGFPGAPGNPLKPASDTLFFSPRLDFQIAFHTDEQGRVTEATWTFSGNTMPLTPLEDVAPALELASAERLRGLDWKHLLTDPPDDGNLPASQRAPDGKALSYYYDASSDSLWFRLDLHNEAVIAAPALNIIVDEDANQETGPTWFGTNTEFTFDKIVTVWLSQVEQAYYGEVGMAEAEAFKNDREWTNLSTGNVTLAVDEDEDALYAGFKRTDLTDSRRMNVIGAVGRGGSWNDDIGDASYATIDLTAQ